MEHGIEGVTLRPAVQEFAVAMEVTLRNNDFKGGWDNESCDIDYLKMKVREEISEMFRADINSLASKEAVDVANVCMMLWTRWTLRPSEYLK